MAGVQAGRLSIEIVAEVARLQQDLDRAKRAVSAASGDIGRGAKAANDNLAGMGRAADALRARMSPLAAAQQAYSRTVQEAERIYRSGAISLREYEQAAAMARGEFRQQVTAMGAANTSMNTVTRSAGAQRAGMQQLSYQLNDVATMYAMGARPMQIFASQSGQIVQAVQLMTGGTSRLAAFLSGPWGMALVSATLVLTPFIAKLFETESAADGARGALEDLAKAREADLAQQTIIGRGQQGLNELLAREAELRDEIQRVSGGRRQGDGSPMFAYRQSQELAEVQREIEAGRMGLYRAQVQAQGDANQRRAAEAAAAAAEAASRQREANRGLAASAREVAAAERDAAREAEQRAREIERQTEATDNYIASLEEEYARLTLSPEAYTARAVAMERATAVTDEQRAAIDRLAASIAALHAEEVARDEANARREKEDQAQERYLEKVKEASDLERKLGEDRLRDLAGLYETLFTDGVDGVWDTFKKQGLAAISQLAAQWTLGLLSGQGGAANNPLSAIGSIFGGQTAANDNPVAGAAGMASTLGSLLGIGSSGGAAGGSIAANPIGAAIAAVPGLNVAIAAAAVTHVVGEGIEKLTGLRFDALGGLFGGLVGGFAVGALKGAVKGNATIGADGSSLGVVDSFGKKKFREMAEGDAGSIISTLAQLAEALGTNLNASLGSVSIGTRNGKYRVDPTGQGILKPGKGAIDFGKDQEAAIAYAMRDLIEDGVLGPISEASRRILQAGGDLEAAIEKAVLIESVPKLLKERLDPLGFALDSIDEQFQTLADALREGGASAQQYADAEKLYRLEREAAIEQFGTASHTLKDYLQSLAVGTNSPLSVRQQLATAEAEFAGYESTIRAGGAVDQDKFTSAAETLLGLSRTANASGAGYFSTFDRVRELTQQAITNVDANTSLPGEGSVVFQQQTANNTQSMARMMEEQNAILREQNDLLRNANDNGNGGGRTGFIGDNRGFAG